MSREGFNPGLRLKIRAPDGDAPGGSVRAGGIDVALTRAFGRAGAPFQGLSLQTSPAEPQWDLSLDDVMAALPEGGLVCVLEAGQDRRAICVLDGSVVDALIEVQTTGRVDKGPGLRRTPTKIDATLTRDFVGLFLSAFAGEMAGEAAVDWPLDLTYGTYLPDTRGLELLLPDQPYHLFSASLDLGEGAKTGQVLLAAPVTGPGAPASEPNAGAPGWGAPWQEIVLSSPAVLDAILLRSTLPLSRVQALQVGDVLSFDRSDLASLSVCDPNGRTVFVARLGRAGSARAIRLVSGAGLKPAPSAKPASSPPESLPGAPLPEAEQTAPPAPA